MFEILELDEWMTKEEVLDAVAISTGVDHESLKLVSLRKQYGGAQSALVVASSDAVQKVLIIGNLRVGMASCRVHPCENKVRCFRCFFYGHM